MEIDLDAMLERMREFKLQQEALPPLPQIFTRDGSLPEWLKKHIPEAAPGPLLFRGIELEVRDTLAPDAMLIVQEREGQASLYTYVTPKGAFTLDPPAMPLLEVPIMFLDYLDEDPPASDTEVPAGS